MWIRNTMVFEIPDLDMDMSQKTRDTMVQTLYHIPASKLNDKGINPHGVGVYLCNIPYDRLTGLASIDYKRAEEEFGYVKLDWLHNTIYDRFENRNELLEAMNTEPKWELLYKQDVIEQLPHINNYYTLINQLPRIDSIEKLAMFIAIIRPGKKYLIDILQNTRKWESIEDRIWLKEDTGYQYKKSHAIAFALSITVDMTKFI